jgi:hypothetical protein
VNWVVRLSATLILIATEACPSVPQQARALIDSVIGSQGLYAADDETSKVTIPREAATIVLDYQLLSPNLALNAWASFASAVYHPAILTRQFILLDDKVNPVLKAVVDADLQVTGLAASSVFDGPHLRTMDVTGLGTVQKLATAFRKGLDEVQRVRRAKGPKVALPSVPQVNAIDPAALDGALSMRGSVHGGVYRAAIEPKAVLDGELIGRELGISTWFSFAGSNSRAVAQREFAATVQEINGVLNALIAKGINIVSIRNYTLGEHPQFVYIRFWEREALSNWPRRFGMP